MIGGILGAIGGIASAFGKTKDRGAYTTANQSGYASLPQDIKSFMLEQIFPSIKDYVSSEYQGLPRRAINQNETDPIFGSTARVEFAKQLADRMNKGTPTTENNVVTMQNGVPTMNRKLYESDPAYKKAWDATLARHQEQFGSGYTTNSNKDALVQSILKRIKAAGV